MRSFVRLPIVLFATTYIGCWLWPFSVAGVVFYVAGVIFYVAGVVLGAQQAGPGVSGVRVTNQVKPRPGAPRPPTTYRLLALLAFQRGRRGI